MNMFQNHLTWLICSSVPCLLLPFLMVSCYLSDLRPFFRLFLWLEHSLTSLYLSFLKLLSQLKITSKLLAIVHNDVFKLFKQPSTLKKLDVHFYTQINIHMHTHTIYAYDRNKVSQDNSYPY